VGLRAGAIIVCAEIAVFSFLQALLNASSHALYALTDGRAHFASAEISLPATWTTDDCKRPFDHGMANLGEEVRAELDSLADRTRSGPPICPSPPLLDNESPFSR